jgi:two-component system, OmpR family, sensor kinase
MRSLDAALLREAELFATSLPSTLSGVDPDDPRLVQARFEQYLALHPGSELHLKRVEANGGSAATSTEGPAPILWLAQQGELPPPVPGMITTVSVGDRDLRVCAAAVEVDGRAIGSFAVYGDLDAARRDGWEAAQRVAVAAAAAGLIGVVALAWAARRSTRPLRELHRAVERAQLDDLSGRVDVPADRRDEIAALAEAFNAMLDRLDAATRARTALFASVSHELRTPVTVARGHLEMLVRGDARDPVASMSFVHDELARTSRLIDDLMLLARARSPDLVHAQPIDIDAFVDGLRMRLDALGAADVTIEQQATSLHGDDDRLTQVVTNLVSNAKTHGGVSTEVAVTVRDGEIEVRDRGPGIDPPVLDRVLQPFVTGGPTPGTGLGLAVVKAIADAHGGSVHVTSSPDTGTTVVVRLPRPKSDPSSRLSTDQLLA